MHKTLVLVCAVMSSPLLAQQEITMSREVVEAVKSAKDEDSAAQTVIDGYNNFYFQSKQEKTNITTALKHFYSRYGESPLKVAQNQKVKKLKWTYDQNEGARVKRNQGNIDLRGIPSEIKDLKEELAENKQAQEEFAGDYPLFTSQKSEDIDRLVAKERKNVRELEEKKANLQRELEECKKAGKVGA
jgi:hypothetical protein